LKNVGGIFVEMCWIYNRFAFFFLNFMVAEGLLEFVGDSFVGGVLKSIG